MINRIASYTYEYIHRFLLLFPYSVAYGYHKGVYEALSSLLRVKDFTKTSNSLQAARVHLIQQFLPVNLER